MPSRSVESIAVLTFLFGASLCVPSRVVAGDCDYIVAVRESAGNRFAAIKIGGAVDGKSKVILSLPAARSCVVDDSGSLSEYLCEWVYSGEATDDAKIRKIYADFQRDVLACIGDSNKGGTRRSRASGESVRFDDYLAGESGTERAVTLSYGFFSHAWFVSFSYSYFKEL